MQAPVPTIRFHGGELERENLPSIGRRLPASGELQGTMVYQAVNLVGFGSDLTSRCHQMNYCLRRRALRPTPRLDEGTMLCICHGAS